MIRPPWKKIPLTNFVNVYGLGSLLGSSMGMQNDKFWKIPELFV